MCFLFNLSTVLWFKTGQKRPRGRFRIPHFLRFFPGLRGKQAIACYWKVATWGLNRPQRPLPNLPLQPHATLSLTASLRIQYKHNHKASNK